MTMVLIHVAGIAVQYFKDFLAQCVPQSRDVRCCVSRHASDNVEYRTGGVRKACGGWKT
jgi:hypothetical protein